MTVQIVSLFIGTVLPILVAVVTTRATHAGTKAVLLAALSAVSGFLSEWLVALNTAAHFDWGTVALTTLGTFMVAVAMHLGLWKPTGIAAATQENIGRT